MVMLHDELRPIARIDFRAVRDPQKVDLLDPRSELFEPHPLNSATKNSIFGPLCD